MTVVFKYLLFLPNNYQGGEGQWLEKKESLSFDEETTLEQLQITIENLINSKQRSIAKNWKDSSATLLSMELF